MVASTRLDHSTNLVDLGHIPRHERLPRQPLSDGAANQRDHPGGCPQVPQQPTTLGLPTPTRACRHSGRRTRTRQQFIGHLAHDRPSANDARSQRRAPIARCGRRSRGGSSVQNDGREIGRSVRDRLHS